MENGSKRFSINDLNANFTTFEIIPNDTKYCV